MAFGKTVIAEALYLVETALGEIRLVPVSDHAIDQFFLESMDRSCLAESGHGAA